MQRICCLLASIGVLAGAASAAFAQGAGEPSSWLPSRTEPLVTHQLLTAPNLSEPDPAQAVELKRWMNDFAAWQTWSAEWTNRRERGWFTSFRERREKPAPPAWLADECATTVADSGVVADACTLLAEWREDPSATRVRQAQVAVKTQTEEPTKTIWWEHVHLDVLWPATQWRSSTYGVIGTHVSTNVYGRLHVFLAPGAMFLNVPARNGTRVWKLATNYGIGYGLFDFNFPGNRRATLHLNLAKAWLLSDTADLVTRRSVDFIGFSMTFKRVP
jgi:hypothetical protein